MLGLKKTVTIGAFLASLLSGESALADPARIHFDMKCEFSAHCFAETRFSRAQIGDDDIDDDSPELNLHCDDGSLFEGPMTIRLDRHDDDSCTGFFTGEAQGGKGWVNGPQIQVSLAGQDGQWEDDRSFQAHLDYDYAGIDLLGTCVFHRY